MRAVASPLGITRAVVATIALGLAGCATLPSGHHAPRDPFERLNRPVFRMNIALDHALLRPIARRAAKVPGPISTGIGNFVGNLLYPVTLVNDFLQGKFHDTLDDVARLVLNTTLGLGGVLDPATAVHLPRNCEDFGITLGKWGVPSGPYLVLPFLGPSTLRDAIGKAPEAYAYVVIPGPGLGVGLYGADAIQSRAQLLPLDHAVESAYDGYGFERSIYLQHRDFLVNGPAPPLSAAVGQAPLAPKVACHPSSCSCGYAALAARR